MKTTVNISEGQRAFPALIKAAESGRIVIITRRGRPVACVISHNRLQTLIETLEIEADPEAMRAIADYKAGRTMFGDVDQIPD